MSDFSSATREIMWNIHPQAWLMYALFGVAMVVFGYGLWRRVGSWRRGKADGERLSDWGRRLWVLTKELLLQSRVRNAPYPGFFHSLIFYSFAVLVVTTAVVAIDYDVGTTLFRGWLYVFLTVAAELAGLLVLVGVTIAAVRRFVTKPKTLKTVFGDGWVLFLIAGMIVTGFLTEGLRIATVGDRWAYLSPVGLGLSFLFAGIGPEASATLHAALWWTHTVLAMGWIASIPFTKFFHVLALPTNVFFTKLRPRGELKRVDIEKLMSSDDFDESKFTVGVAQAADYTWKQRLDFDACISCGRCEEVCPAMMAGHPFSPREFIQANRDLVRKADGANGHAKAAEGGNGGNGDGAKTFDVVGGALDEKFIWYCRTCTACMEVCPASIDHVDTLMEVRRNELLMKGRAPTEAQRAIKLLQQTGNPFGPRGQRSEWIEQMKVTVIPPGGDVDVLFWIGCCTTYDPTKQKIAADLFKLLDHCGITYGVLGADEQCCGDPARLIGDEGLFQEIAKAQVERIKSRTFRVLLVNCPHCYNVLKNEYPQFGGSFKIAHHAEFLHEMLWSGALKPVSGEARRIVYHDPCYLGRYANIYEAPREVLKAIPGAAVAEMGSHKDQSLCCGGGGGHYWMDLKSTTGDRINNLRVDQARAAGADLIVTGCPYCQQMLNDSVKMRDLDDQIRVVDLSTLVLESLEAPTRNP
jgi:Fe-S oxidoreductase/nitrate reductase gamma subunit